MSKATIRGIDHIGICVPDIEPATKFLEDAFGGKVIYETHSKQDKPYEGSELEQFIGAAAGTNIAAIRLIQMERGPDIELFEMHAPEQREAARSSDFGMQHMAFYADDPQAAVARFEKAGGVMFMQPTLIPIGPEKGENNTACYGRAPWGMLVEFISLPDRMAYEDITPLRRWHNSKT